MSVPLTIHSALGSWRFDLQLLVIGVVAAIYWWASVVAARRGEVVSRARRGCFLIVGALVWALASVSFIGVYAGQLFWVRALQVVLLLFVAPLGLALGKPVTVLYAAVGARGQRRIDAVLGSRSARVLTYPAVTSLTMLATPWLFYLTGWYTASLEHEFVDQATRMVLVVIGFVYFYSRLQADPVPRRFSQLISFVITLVEVIGDGVLGIIIWQGPLIAADYYAGIGRTWGPDLRTDQTIGAGVLWILGDFVGLPFLLALMYAFRSDEQSLAAAIDAELDATPITMDESSPPEESSALWWENDPQLRARYRDVR